MTKATTTSSAKRATTTTTTSTKGEAKRAYFTIVELCAKHNRDPKIIRAKARRNHATLDKHLFPALSDERWAFKNSSLAIVEALLFKRS